uniref:Uncharacterized protein n=1 Tax=Anopheles dirus TaxID=7168 RepID=A0A182NUJ9_9DIPT
MGATAHPAEPAKWQAERSRLVCGQWQQTAEILVRPARPNTTPAAAAAAAETQSSPPSAERDPTEPN